MIAKTYYTLLLTALTCSTVGNVFAAGDAIPSWAAFQTELSSNRAETTLPEMLHASPTFKSLVVNRNTNAFVEMTVLDDYFLLKLAGVYGLQQLDKQKAFECGLRIALSTPVTNVAATILYHDLSTVRLASGYTETLSEVFRTAPVGPDAHFVIMQLPHDQLYEWFHSETRTWVIPTYEAFVLSRLWNDMKRAGRQPTDKMKNTLSGFAAMPGVPRSIYLGHADETNAAYKSTMKYALEDESLPDTDLLNILIVKTSYIKKNIKLDELNISQKRRDAITAGLDTVVK